MESLDASYKIMRITPLFLIILLATTLRIVVYSDESMNGDEIFSLEMATLDTKRAIKEISLDIVHPPLYYLTLKAWINSIGSTNELGIRALSLLFSLLTVAMSYAVTLQASKNRNLALIGALLVALSSVQAQYSLLLRSYAMYGFIVITLIYLYLLLGQKEYRHRPWLWIAITAIQIIAVWTHYIAWMYIAVTFLAIILFSDKQIIRNWFFSITFTGLTFFLWAIKVIPALQKRQGLNENLGWVSVPKPYQLAKTVIDYVGQLAISGGTTVISMFIFMIVLLGIITYYKSNPKHSESEGNQMVLPAVLIGGAAILPPLLSYIVSIPPLSIPLWGARHISPSQPLFIIFLLLCTQQILMWKHSMGVLVLIALVLIQLFWIKDNCLGCYERTPYKEVVEYTEKDNLKYSPVFTTKTSKWNIGKPYDYYAKRQKKIKILTTGTESLPDSFWILFRPAIGADVKSINEITTLNRRNIQREKYFSSKVGKWGVKAVYFSLPINSQP